MARVKRGVTAHAKHKKVLEQAKGFYGRRKNTIRTAKAVEKYGELARILYAKGYDIVVIGGPQETPLAHRIQREAPRTRDLTGRTDFARIAVLGAKAALAVGNDTGPLHLAAAAGAPTVVLFSSASDPALSAPRGRVAVLKAERLTELPVPTVAQKALSLINQTVSAA